MEHKEAWQIAGKICDMLHEDGLVTTVQQHERMADILVKYGDLYWGEYLQQWYRRSEITGFLEPIDKEGAK